MHQTPEYCIYKYVGPTGASDYFGRRKIPKVTLYSKSTVSKYTTISANLLNTYMQTPPRRNKFYLQKINLLRVK